MFWKSSRFASRTWKFVSTSTRPIKPTCNKGTFSGPNNLRMRPESWVHISPILTHRTHFRDIASACSSIDLTFHASDLTSARVAYIFTKLESGNISGMMSSSPHKREHSLGQQSATCLGIAAPIIVSKSLSPYARS